MIPQGNHVNSLFPLKTKFPPASLLVFLFLIIEIKKVSPSAVSPDGVTKVRNAFEKHYGASLTDVHFRTGNGSRDDRRFCFLDGCLCIPGLSDECCGLCDPLAFLCWGGKGKCVEEGNDCGKDDKCCSPNGEIYDCNPDGTCAYACTRVGYQCTPNNTTCCNNGKLPAGCDSRSKTCETCTKNGDECSEDDNCCDGENGNHYACSPDERCEKLCEIDPDVDDDKKECDDDDDCCNDSMGNEYQCEDFGDDSLCVKKCSPDENLSGNCKVDGNCCPDKDENYYHCSEGTCKKRCHATSGEPCRRHSECCNDESRNKYSCSGGTCKRVCDLNPGVTCQRNSNDKCCNDDKGNAYGCIFQADEGKCRKICSADPNQQCSSDEECCNDNQGDVYDCEDGTCQRAKFLRIKQSVRKTLW